MTFTNPSIEERHLHFEFIEDILYGAKVFIVNIVTDYTGEIMTESS